MYVDKHQSFLQVDFNTLGIKVSYKVILSLPMGMIKPSQSTESNKFVISLQDLKKEVTNGVHFLHVDKHQSFCKLTLMFLMEVARHIRSTQNSKLVKCLQYIKKIMLELLLCSIVMQNIQIFYGVPVMFVYLIRIQFDSGFNPSTLFMVVGKGEQFSSFVSTN